MAGIFINYRRDDAPGMAGRLFDHLARHFSRRGLFMDVDAMKPGLDFVKQLDAQVSQCDVLLAIIGQRWLESADESGTRRLDSNKDYVRIEIASALKRDIPVIPVLVDGATMPPEEKLPEDLRPLTRRHALELRHTRFSADADAILSALNGIVPTKRSPWVWPLVVSGAAATCVIVGIALWQLWPASRQQTVAASAPSPTSNVALPPPPPTPMVAESNGPEAQSRQQAAQEAAARQADARQRRENAKNKADEAKAARSSSANGPAPAPTAPAAVAARALRVALGDSMERVQTAYGIKTDAMDTSHSGQKQWSYSLPLDGIRLFFQSDKTLNNIRVDAPFAGDVEGIRIGDPLETVLAKWGQPYTAPWDFGGNKAYAYRINGRVVRFDIDRSNKVATIFQFVSN